jgi:hypothetical protein
VILKMADSVGWLNWADKQLLDAALNRSEKPAQPGPIFSERPQMYLEWVDAEFRWIARQLALGVGRDGMEDARRNTRIWIAEALAQRRTPASEIYVPRLLEMAACLDDGRQWDVRIKRRWLIHHMRPQDLAV